MTDYGASDTSITSLGPNQFPISEVYVPNTGLKALGGGTKQTDGNGKDYAPALVQVTNSNVNGSATAANSAPVVLASDYRGIHLGDVTASREFTYNNGAASVGGAINAVEFSLFNPANSGKSIWIYRVLIMDNHAGDLPVITRITTDPALTVATVQTKNLGLTTISVASATFSSAAQTQTGTILWRSLITSNNAPIEAIPPGSGEGWLLPNGTACGLAVFINIGAAANYHILMEAKEF